MKIAKTIFGLLLSVLLMPTNSNSQTSSIGFRCEPFLFLSKTEGTGPLAYKHKDEEAIYLTSFYLSYKYQMSKNISLGTRAGYLWTNEDRYNGFEISELIDININDKAFFVTGINIHFNKGDSVREFFIKNIVVPSFIIGTGLKLSEVFNMEFQYLIPLNKEYKTSSFNGPVYYKLAGMLKLSVGFDWEL